jgi:hypothetical protein
MQIEKASNEVKPEICEPVISKLWVCDRTSEIGFGLVIWGINTGHSSLRKFISITRHTHKYLLYV